MSASLAEPVQQLERMLEPYYALQHLWWSRLLEVAGLAGWRRVSEQVYPCMKAAHRLLCAASEEAVRQGPELAAFAGWSHAHAEEEQPHHEWYLEDLVAAGCEREALLKVVPDEEVLELIGVQFALVHTGAPTAVLGYLFATECHPPDAQETLQVARRLGLPRAAVRTLLHHSQVDVEHREEILQLIGYHGRAPEQFRPMLLAALQSLKGWSRLFQRYSTEAAQAKATGP